MTKEVLKMALDKLCEYMDEPERSPVVKKLKEALAQPEQDPVAWMYTSKWKGNELFITRYQSELTTYKADEVWPLYKSPPKRLWVGLTEEEVRECYAHVEGVTVSEAVILMSVVRITQAKLKGKNT
jgi:hypothetical protein